MRTVSEHQRIVADLIAAGPAVRLPLARAEGLILAADVVAGLSLPGFDNSAMDGVRGDAHRRGHLRPPRVR